jgi:transcriptional regulator with XRE-family HTH domain
LKGLAKCRERAGMTQKQLAAKMAVDPNTIWRWENSQRSPDVETICHLASLLNCTTDELLNPSPAPVKPGEKVKAARTA